MGRGSWQATGHGVAESDPAEATLQECTQLFQRDTESTLYALSIVTASHTSALHVMDKTLTSKWGPTHNGFLSFIIIR